MIKKTVFLDRDGVINRDSPDYIKSVKEFIFIPGSINAVKKLTENGFTIIIITNQSAVSREMISLSGLAEIHEFMVKKLAGYGGIIKDIFFCPHHPKQKCKCRKPLPKMILKAAQKYNIDLKSSFMVGDSAKDIECAVNAGCGRNILVQTGNYPEAVYSLEKNGIRPGYTAHDLNKASDYIINMMKNY